MKTKKVNLFVQKWWKPLFWCAVFLGPVFGILAGIVVGAFCGMLIGYEKCLETAGEKLHGIISKLP